MGINRNAIGSTNHSLSNPPFMPQNQVDMDELVEQTEEQSRVTAAHRSDIRRARAARTGGPTLNSVSCNTGMDV
jgi:Tfp pilus assembly protein PilN